MHKRLKIVLKEYPGYPVFRAKLFELNPFLNGLLLCAWCLLIPVGLALLVLPETHSIRSLLIVVGVSVMFLCLILDFFLKDQKLASCPKCSSSVFLIKVDTMQRKYFKQYERYYLCQHCNVAWRNSFDQDDSDT